ncbi:NAD(P)H-hydrate dehydratase [Agromyces sp. CFH 90414]|uniref:ADP-dependent (S)-NAD(P)H-hydrate dehydratase n=1 Tax=Agromyces agglutinans TaxID=2662258 RepID=A0A6I2FD76_9MICO|nr:ADP/ATP-dependent (S)-NAD(P)H-hydrate dehydratase [Agromyces agglutinans]MRG61757.1 NAD(P)H-hydrate dehydratase [Agromyces agglutinans]
MGRDSWGQWSAAEAADWIRRPAADDDKYRRGVVGLFTGSAEYPGAAVLGVEAAHRTGVGMVRYAGPKAVRAAVLAHRPETVVQPGRVQAWVLGSGLDAGHRSFLTSGELQHALASGLPVVLDAGALDLVGTHTGPTVITPHAGELARLLSSREIDATVDDVRADPGAWAARAARELRVVTLLKGATTYVCDPEGTRFALHASTHWLAAAGTGDVLAGILGALAATHHEILSTDATALTRIAATAVFVHGEAARLASDHVAGGPITALDLAGAIPRVVGSLLG